MGLICKLLGHRYEGCHCVRCGALHPQGHQWVEAEGKCEHTCARCGLTEALPHDWFHCRCKRCGEQRNDHHLWLKKSACEQVCRICGAERETHAWRHVDRGLDRCAVCGRTHRLSAEEIARRDEEWTTADSFEEAYESGDEYPPEQD